MQKRSAMNLTTTGGRIRDPGIIPRRRSSDWRGQETKPTPCGPVPTENQLRWQDMEMYAFIHYSLNTYTDQEWGFGNEDPKLFNPSDLEKYT